METNKLCLGTVQFGMKYGINNKIGKPSKNEVFNMLDAAIENGIEDIDTAVAYGDAEELLGEYLKVKNINKNLRIISKLKPNIIDESCGNMETFIEEEIRESLRRLNIDNLDGYLLHTPTYFYNKNIMNALIKAKDKNLVKNIGVSIYETKHALDVVSSGIVDYIQIPYSVFDQRMDNTDFFEICKKNNVTVYARSAFLQGLILMKNEDIPKNLSITKKYLQIFDEVINKYGISRSEAAFRFTSEHPGVDYIVFGVDNIQQLKEDISFVKNEIDFNECREELKRKLGNVEKNIIFPSLWSEK